VDERSGLFAVVENAAEYSTQVRDE
jgi:hypothetical protein